MESEPRGRLRVSAPVNFARLHVAPAVAEFLERYPAVSLELSSSDQLVDLVEEGYDLAIRIGALPDSSLIARRVAGMRRVICASPSYLEKAGVPRVPDDLADRAAALLDRRVEFEVTPGTEQRREERQALDVIPVQM